MSSGGKGAHFPAPFFPVCASRLTRGARLKISSRFNRKYPASGYIVPLLTRPLSLSGCTMDTISYNSDVKYRRFVSAVRNKQRQHLPAGTLNAASALSEALQFFACECVCVFARLIFIIPPSVFAFVSCTGAGRERKSEYCLYAPASR